MTHLITEPYLAQRERWPAAGRHIMAQYDQTTIIVYQAFNPAIGHFAARHGHFGGEFSGDTTPRLRQAGPGGSRPPPPGRGDQSARRGESGAGRGRRERSPSRRSG